MDFPGHNLIVDDLCFQMEWEPTLLTGLLVAQDVEEARGSWQARTYR